MKRTDLHFRSSGVKCAAWLYEPEDFANAPCVVLAHGFAGTHEARLWAFAERFAEAGIPALVFDYRHFGDSEGNPRQLLNIRRQLDDWRSAIAFARTINGIDAERIAAWGTSLGGGHVITIAAEDRKLAAAVSMNPFVSGLVAIRAMPPRTALRLVRAGIRDQLHHLAGRPPFMIPAVGPEGSIAAIANAEAEASFRAMFEPGVEPINAVAARILLRLGSYRPGTKTSQVKCPWLVQVGDQDIVTPPKPALRAAARAPRVEVRHFSGGHFAPYLGDGFEQVVAEQVEFLSRHLLKDGSTATGRASATVT